MWVPTSFSLGLVMALGALCCWGSWSTTLVATKDTMNFEKFYVNFSISFLLTGWIVGFIGGSVGDGTWPSGGSTTESFSYATELFGHKAGCYPLSMLGGLLWNLANILLCKGITMMGNAVGFPLCVGLGLVSGAITAYVIKPAGDLGLLAAGICVALLAVCAVGLLSHLKERELGEAETESESASESASESDPDTDVRAVQVRIAEPSMGRKLVVCVIGGLFLGLSNIGVTGATSDRFLACSLSPYANQSFFSLGVFLSSCLLVPLVVSCPIEGGKGSTLGVALKGYGKVHARDHFFSFLGGFILCMGFFCFNLGAPKLGSATAYSIGQSAPLVGILWGTFFFKEFKGTSCRVQGLIPVVCLLFIGAILLIGVAGS